MQPDMAIPSSAHKFETLPVQVHNLHRSIVFEVLAELGDVHIHAAGVEVGVVAPNDFQRKTAADGLVEVLAE